MGMSGPSGGRGRRAALSEINVTPFVDVMLVLLIIFMVTAPLMQQGIEIDLPETKASGVETPSEPFVLSIKSDKKVYIGKVSVPINSLQNKVAAIFKTRNDKQVYIKADQTTPYGIVANVMAEVRAAGIYKIALVTLPK